MIIELPIPMSLNFPCEKHVNFYFYSFEQLKNESVITSKSVPIRNICEVNHSVKYTANQVLFNRAIVGDRSGR